MAMAMVLRVETVDCTWQLIKSSQNRLIEVEIRTHPTQPQLSSLTRVINIIVNTISVATLKESVDGPITKPKVKFLCNLQKSHEKIQLFLEKTITFPK